MRMGLLVWGWDPCPWGVVGGPPREGCFGCAVIGPPFWGVSSFGWVTVTVLSSLCARLSPKKLVASRSSVTA
jgi:hypothetical protein